MTATSSLRFVASALISIGVALMGAGCSDDGDQDADALLDHVNEVRAERGAEPWPSSDDVNFQSYLQVTRDDCASNFQRESTYERYYTEEGEQTAEDYRARLAVLCPEEAATLVAPEADPAGSTDTSAPTSTATTVETESAPDTSTTAVPPEPTP